MRSGFTLSIADQKADFGLFALALQMEVSWWYLSLSISAMAMWFLRQPPCRRKDETLIDCLQIPNTKSINIFLDTNISPCPKAKAPDNRRDFREEFF
jgi:hypothetical protein